MRTVLPASLTSSSRRASWRRTKLLRVVCALLAATAVWLIGSPLLPRPVEVGDVVLVMARDVPIGTTLGTDDVRVERRPSDQHPSGALARPDAVIGRVTAGPMTEGEVVLAARFRGPGQLAGLPADRVAVSVPVVETGLLDAIRAADVVQVMAAGSGQVVAAGARVLSVGRFDEGVLGQGADAGGHVVLALSSEEARAVAAAMSGQTGPSGFVLALRAH